MYLNKTILLIPWKITSAKIGIYILHIILYLRILDILFIFLRFNFPFILTINMEDILFIQLGSISL